MRGRMTKKRTIIAFVLVACIWMAWVDGSTLNYFIKALLKIFTFSMIPLLFFKMIDKTSIRNLFMFKQVNYRIALILGASLFVLILLVYFMIGKAFDLSLVKTILEENFGSKTLNFIPIAFYIAIINSFLEEFFFRGLAYLALLKVSSRRFANTFSAMMFAFYHVFLMFGLFHYWLYLGALGLMIIAGYLFNTLDHESQTIIPSWLVHSLTNWGLNTIGLLLLKIL
jgi:membrane protease YdiL (CAAX protease family)